MKEYARKNIERFQSASTPQDLAVRVLKRATGVIIDVRNNGGGSSDLGYSILSYFASEPLETTSYAVPSYIATHRACGRSQELDAPNDQGRAPAADIFSGPVALLIGPRTYSAAEDFPVAFDQMNRGAIVGEPSGGSTG